MSTHRHTQSELSLDWAPLLIRDRFGGGGGGASANKTNANANKRSN